jgi:hypothetical protein
MGSCKRFLYRLLPTRNIGLQVHIGWIALPLPKISRVPQFVCAEEAALPSAAISTARYGCYGEAMLTANPAGHESP